MNLLGEFIMPTYWMTVDPLLAVTLLLVCHFIGDFLLQTDKMARNKSHFNNVLLEHVIVYSIPFTLLFGVFYAAINMILHFLVDYVTSRWAGKYHMEGRRSAFFRVIGLDQLLHSWCLIGTFIWIFR